MGETVKIGTDDPHMHFETPDGRTFRNHSGVAEMPASDAAMFLRAGIPGVGVYRSVRVVASEAYRQGWERIFGSKERA